MCLLFKFFDFALYSHRRVAYFAMTAVASRQQFVIGKSANGLTSWKTADGQSLKTIEAEV